MNYPCPFLYQGSLVQGWTFFRWVGPERSTRATTRGEPEEYFIFLESPFVKGTSSRITASHLSLST